MKKKRNTAAGHRYLIYARVSPKGSTWAAQETSIGVQLQECRQYILNRVDPLAEFTELKDEFKSGKDLNRPGMQQILADIDSGRPSFDTLVVWQLDRLSRNLADAAPLFERLRDAGLGFVAIRQPYLSATGAMARFNLTQTIAIAQLEREMTSERIAAKMHWIAQSGKVPWGIIPIGYRRKPDAKNTIEVVPEEAAIVREIFFTYIDCCHRKCGFAPLRAVWEAHQDKLSETRNLYRILRNRFYIGEIVFKDEVFRGEHEPIIDRQIFEEVQSLLPGKRYNVPRPSRQKYDYLLSGLVRCKCDPERYMTPASVKKKGKRYFYYKCTDSGCGCEINAEKLDAAVLDAIRRVALDPDYIRECYDFHQQQIAEAKRQQEPRIAAALAERDAAEADLAHIDEMFLRGVVTAANKDYWNEKLLAARGRLEQAKSDYAEQVARLEPLSDQQKFSAILKSLSGWAELLDRAADDVTLKRNLIMSMVYRVRCVDRGKFEVDLVLDAGSGRKKIGITSDPEVMPNCDKWWSIRHLVITCAVAIAIGGKYREKKEPRNGEANLGDAAC